MNVDRRYIFGSKWSYPGSKREDGLFWDVVYDNTCWANELGPGIIIVFDLEKFLRRRECWQSFSESVFIVGLNSVVGRENWPWHFIGPVIINFLIVGCRYVGRGCHGLFDMSGFSLLSVLVWLFVSVGKSMSHCEWNSKYT